jgi:hypothetical protein
MEQVDELLHLGASFARGSLPRYWA